MKKIKKYILFVAMFAIANQANAMDLPKFIPKFIYDIVSNRLSLANQLYYAIQFNDLEKIDSMIEYNEFAPFMKRIDGYNPFELAIKFRRPEVLRKVIAADPDRRHINQKNCNIRVSWVGPGTAGLHEEADELCCSLRFAIEYSYGKTVVDLEYSSYSIKEDRYPLDDIDKEMISMLIDSGAIMDFNFYDIQRLINAEIAYNVPNSQGQTPLVVCVKDGLRFKASLARKLMQVGVDPRIPNRDGLLAHQLVAHDPAKIELCDRLMTPEEVAQLKQELLEYYNKFTYVLK